MISCFKSEKFLFLKHDTFKVSKKTINIFKSILSSFFKNSLPDISPILLLKQIFDHPEVI